ncbi:hypothetical protein HOY82DRAFT_453742, partial [Tuber indicum]
VEFLAPYSPDTSPIKEAFSVYKSWIRRNGEEIRCYPGDPGVFLLRGVFECLKEHHGRNFFRNSGYI